jgi:tRNA(fMet)-specific endonuclease VapC
VDEALILETTFLIDLERERRRGGRGPAHGFLSDHPGARLCITPTIAGELASGLDPGERTAWEELLSALSMLEVDREVCWQYGRLFRFLKQNGLLIGANDLWIAATALVHDTPLVTRNHRHFRRIPELRVLTYGS